MTRAITVFSSSSTSVDRRYFEAASALGGAIAREGWSLVYGGNRVGPMGALADAVREAGGKVIGITPRLFHDHGVVDHHCDELIVTDTMRQRKQLLEDRGDAFVILPGGPGTLEEFTEAIVGRFLELHRKPVILINLDGFWTPLIDLLHAWRDKGFCRQAMLDQLVVVDSVVQCIELLRTRR
jgi:uncharacterized protein (TIGR00730 family)